VIFEYGKPADIPRLMAHWLELLRELNQAIKPGDTQQALAGIDYFG